MPSPSFWLDSDRSVTFTATSESARVCPAGSERASRTVVSATVEAVPNCRSTLTVHVQRAGDDTDDALRVVLAIDPDDLEQLGATIQRAINAAVAERQIEASVAERQARGLTA